jgi:hypothetical protein
VETLLSLSKTQLHLALGNGNSVRDLAIGQYDGKSLWMQTVPSQSGPFPSPQPSPLPYPPGSVKSGDFDYYIMLKDNHPGQSPIVKTYFVEAFPSSNWKRNAQCTPNTCDCERPDATNKDGVLVNWSKIPPPTSPPKPSGQTHSGEGPEPGRN